MQIVFKDHEVEVHNPITRVTSRGLTFDEAIQNMRQKTSKETGLPLTSINVFLTRNFTSNKDTPVRYFKFLDHYKARNEHTQSIIR